MLTPLPLVTGGVNSLMLWRTYMYMGLYVFVVYVSEWTVFDVRVFNYNDRVNYCSNYNTLLVCMYE